MTDQRELRERAVMRICKIMNWRHTGNHTATETDPVSISLDKLNEICDRLQPPTEPKEIILYISREELQSKIHLVPSTNSKPIWGRPAGHWLFQLTQFEGAFMNNQQRLKWTSSFLPSPGIDLRTQRYPEADFHSLFSIPDQS